MLSSLATGKAIVYTIFITNNHALCYLWWKENLIRHQKVSQYYEHDCRDQIFVKGYGFLSFDKNIGNNLSGK